MSTGFGVKWGKIKIKPQTRAEKHSFIVQNQKQKLQNSYFLNELQVLSVHQKGVASYLSHNSRLNNLVPRVFSKPGKRPWERGCRLKFEIKPSKLIFSGQVLITCDSGFVDHVKLEDTFCSFMEMSNLKISICTLLLVHDFYLKTVQRLNVVLDL